MMQFLSGGLYESSAYIARVAVFPASAYRFFCKHIPTRHWAEMAATSSCCIASMVGLAVDLSQTLQAIGSANIAARMRLRGHNTQALGRYIGMGADGIIVPNVATPSKRGHSSGQWSIRPPELWVCSASASPGTLRHESRRTLEGSARKGGSGGDD